MQNGSFHQTILRDPDASAGIGADLRSERVFFVSPDGDDRGSGTQEAPFATFSRARQAVRDLKVRNGLPQGGVTVRFKPGLYPVNETICFSKEDSGEAGRPVRYEAEAGAEVIFSGGVRLDGSAFHPAPDEITGQILDPDAAPHILEIDLSAAGCAGIEDSGWDRAPYRPELYVENKRQTIAKWPNDGYAIISAYSYDEEKGCVSYPIPKERAECYAALPSFRYYGFPRFDWSDYAAEMTSGEIDAENARMFLPQYPSIRENATYYVYNILAELDAPGEYYWDPDTEKLYYYPDGELAGKKIVFATFSSNWFLFDAASYLEFAGFTFENARTSVFATDKNPSSHITIRNCLFRCLGTDAVSLEGDHYLLRDNEVCETGTAGFCVSGGTPDIPSPSDNVITNNRIHDYSQTFAVYNAGVSVSGFGFEISHNEIYNAPHEAIAFNCGGTRIEYNYVHDVCRQTDDAGAIYSGRRWDWGGNVLRYNYLKDIVCTCFENYHPNGIYLDDAISDQLCFGNILDNIGGGAFANGGGKYNTICNNILIRCDYADDLDERGTNWMYAHVAYPEGGIWECEIRSNYLDKLHRYYFPKNLLQIERRDLSDLYNRDDPGSPSYGDVSRNVTVGPKKEPFGNVPRPFGTTTGNMIYASIDEVGFVDPENGNFNLRSDAPVFRDILGFEPIPFDQIGILDDAGTSDAKEGSL